jgi:hypothetical protein
MDAREKILSFLGQNGPSVPTAIAKQLEGDSFFASAYLSEMKEQGKIKISSLKMGGSPLYYIPGQEEMLQNFSDNLNEKEKRIYDMLREKKILRDSSLVPVFRAAIRMIKDFAVPLTVDVNGNKELFWKWSLLANNEAGEIVRKLLGIKKEEPKPAKVEGKTEVRKEEIKEKIEEKKEEREEKIEEAAEEEVKEAARAFIDEVREYFSRNNIKIIDEKIIRKTEMEFIVEVPSPVGQLKYYVKAKSKKRLNDGDLSSVFIQAQSRRMPALFLGKGELTKKAMEMLENEFKGMRYNKI